MVDETLGYISILRWTTLIEVFDVDRRQSSRAILEVRKHAIKTFLD
jgi:hypothetical protein